MQSLTTLSVFRKLIECPAGYHPAGYDSRTHYVTVDRIVLISLGTVIDSLFVTIRSDVPYVND